MKTLKISTESLHKGVPLEGSVSSYSCEAIADAVQEQRLQINYTVELIEKEILVRGKVSGEISIGCCRCLETYSYPVSLPFTQSYPAITHEVDLEDEVRQLLILNLPAKPLCRTDCQGICAECGKNRNKERCTCDVKPHDPRWEKLKDLLPKK